MSKNKINVGFKSSQNIKAPENCACVNGLKVSTNKTQKTIDLTNNKAEYYAELAEEYKNEAKKFKFSKKVVFSIYILSFDFVKITSIKATLILLILWSPRNDISINF